nr:hypothetical protein [Methylocapsa sp. RX1]
MAERPRAEGAAHDEALSARVMSEPDATLAALRNWLLTEHNMTVSWVGVEKDCGASGAKEVIARRRTRSRHVAKAGEE